MTNKLQEGAIKSRAHDLGYFYDGKMWVHDKTGHRLSDDAMIELVSKGSPSTERGKQVSNLISKKISAIRKTWKSGDPTSDPDFRKPGEESKTSFE